jgi:hypothetical protein
LPADTLCRPSLPFLRLLRDADTERQLMKIAGIGRNHQVRTLSNG